MLFRLGLLLMIFLRVRQGLYISGRKTTEVKRSSHPNGLKGTYFQDNLSLVMLNLVNVAKAVLYQVSPLEVSQFPLLYSSTLHSGDSSTYLPLLSFGKMSLS